MSDGVFELDLGRPVRADELPKLARAFFAWWGAELKGLLPARYQTLFARDVRPLVLVVEAEAWRLVGAGAGAGAGAAGDVVLELARGDGALRDDIARDLPAVRGRAVRVLMPKAHVLVRRVEMPMLSDARVKAAIELQIDRLTPFKAEAVRFSCRVVERVIETNKMTVEVAVAPAAAVAEVEARLAALELKAAAIDVSARDGRVTGQGFDLRAQAAGVSRGRERLVNFGIGVGAAFLWLMAFYAWSSAGEVEIARWQARAVEIKPQAERSAKLKREIELLTEPVEIAKARGSWSALAVLGELTRLMPNNAHLIDLRLTDRGAEIAGLAADAPALIAKLESSKMFAEVRFKSPVTRRPNAVQDRFDIALSFEGRRGP